MVSIARRSEVRVGATRVVFVPDGAAWVEPTVFFPASAPDGWAPHAAYLRDDGRVPISIGSFLIQSQGQNVLVDLGLGAVDFEVPGLAEFRGGALLDNLSAEGLRPEAIDTVFFTHLHHDHVGWTSNIAPAPTADPLAPVTGLTFGNAQHLAAAEEWDRWKGTDQPTGPDPRAVQAPLAETIEFARAGDEIAPGVRAVASPGHTPGHLSLQVRDRLGVDATTVLILGDVMHSQVQVVESQWTCAFDDNPDEAADTRQRILTDAERGHVVVAGGHFAGSVFGRVQAPVARRAWHSQSYWSAG